ncbi:MAG: hypothetical protein NTY48_03650 [Candidatus Diapherotrites archaeon]|nr:hypothetical protein [Candidatus Diapherotrites archaeon]
MVEFQKIADKWFGKIQADIDKKIANFVAFFFFMIALGALAGVIIAQRHPNQAMLAVIAPAVTGLIAYYNRAFAAVVFAILVIALFFM